jgi:hypothetical protein
MKIDYNDLISFCLIFMILQYILFSIESHYYMDMITDIQQYKFNMFKNDRNQFSFKNIIVYTLLYGCLPIILYFYIIYPHKSLFEGFCLSSLLFFSCDIGMFSFFDIAKYYYKVLLFDIFVVAGIGMLLSQYIIYHYNVKSYISFLFILYILSMLCFFYICYQYNPDTSNIGISLL